MEILKWKTKDGRCTHKKNNSGERKLMDCTPRGCPYFEECRILKVKYLY